MPTLSEVRQAPICTLLTRISHVLQGCQENPMKPILCFVTLQLYVLGLSASHGLMEHSPFNGAFEEVLHLYLTKNWPPWRSMRMQIYKQQCHQSLMQTIRPDFGDRNSYDGPMVPVPGSGECQGME